MSSFVEVLRAESWLHHLILPSPPAMDVPRLEPLTTQKRITHTKLSTPKAMMMPTTSTLVVQHRPHAKCTKSKVYHILVMGIKHFQWPYNLLGIQQCTSPRADGYRCANWNMWRLWQKRNPTAHLELSNGTNTAFIGLEVWKGWRCCETCATQIPYRFLDDNFNRYVGNEYTVDFQEWLSWYTILLIYSNMCD